MASFVTNHKQPYASLTKIVATKPLRGKTFFVTGAGRGVGKYITRAIADAGAKRIGLLGRDKARIQSAKEEYSKDFPAVEFVAYAADITNAQDVAAAFKDFGPADILINNAGHFPDEKPFVEENLASWWSGFEINILGSAIVTQNFLKINGPKTSAVVLNVSSVAAHMRFPLTAWSGYNGSKMGQARIFEMIRFEHPEVRFVNCHPGNIESDGFTRSGATEPPNGMTNGVLAGQFFVWLCTEEANFLSGRFVWAEWDIDELKAKEKQITDDDLLLTTIDGFNRGI